MLDVLLQINLKADSSQSYIHTVKAQYECLLVLVCMCEKSDRQIENASSRYFTSLIFRNVRNVRVKSRVEQPPANFISDGLLPMLQQFVNTSGGFSVSEDMTRGSPLPFSVFSFLFFWVCLFLFLTFQQLQGYIISTECQCCM